MQFSIKKNQRNSIFIVQARSAIFIPRLFHALCIWYNYNRFSIKYFRSRAIGLNAPRTEYSSATGEYPWVLVPIFAIRQSEAVSAVLISCDIKLPARYGYAIMIGYGDRIRTVVYVSEAGPARLVKPWLNQTLICLLCHRSMPKVKYLKDDRNHSLNSTLQEYNVDIICSSKIIIELRSRETIPVPEQMICPRTKFQAYFRAKWRLLFIYIFWSFFLFYEVKLRSYDEPSKIFLRPLFATWARGTSIHFILFWFSN